jgi:trigger factor
LESKINVINESLNEIEVSLEFPEIEKEIEKEVINKSKSLQIQGFRKGKAPISIIKKLYGDSLDHEASEKVSNDNFWKIVKEQDIKLIGEPRLVDLNFEPGKKLSYKVQYDVLPKIDIKDYSGLTIEIPDFKVKDEEVQSEIDYIKKANSEFVDAEVVENKEYQVTLDLQRVDEAGAPMEGVKSDNVKVDLNNPNVNADLAMKSLGKKVGDVFDFVFTDKVKAENDTEDEKKETEIFRYEAKIKGIKKIVTAELTEELVKKVTKDKVSTEAELIEDIRKDLQNYYDQQIENITHNRLAEKIVSNNPFKAPSTLVHNMLHSLMEEEEEKSKQEGYAKYDHHEAHHRLEGTAEWAVKWYLLKIEMIKKENLQITDEEINELAKIDAEKTGISIDKLLNYYKGQNYTEKLLDKKLFEFLEKNNTITRVDPIELSKKEKEAVKNEKV